MNYYLAEGRMTPAHWELVSVALQKRIWSLFMRGSSDHHFPHFMERTGRSFKKFFDELKATHRDQLILWWNGTPQHDGPRPLCDDEIVAAWNDFNPDPSSHIILPPKKRDGQTLVAISE
jgi:hypothetical protein